MSLRAIQSVSLVNTPMIIFIENFYKILVWEFSEFSEHAHDFLHLNYFYHITIYDMRFNQSLSALTAVYILVFDSLTPCYVFPFSLLLIVAHHLFALKSELELCLFFSP